MVDATLGSGKVSSTRRASEDKAREGCDASGTGSEGTHAVVSVVIPAHNAGTTLKAQIDALAAQDAPYLDEVIVVDSLSTDDTADVAAAACREWAKVRVVRAERSGANVARNTGVRASSSPSVLLCDADDVVSERWLSSLASALVDNDLVRGRTETRLLNDAATIAARGSLESDAGTPSGMFGGLGGCCGFTRSAWRTLGGLREHHKGADDVEFFWRAHDSGFQVGYVPDAVVHYRLRPEFKALYRQQKQWASGRALLHKEFGDAWMPRRTVLGAVKGWGWVIVHLPDRGSDDPATRGRWVRAHANNVGRLQGSLRHRVFFP